MPTDTEDSGDEIVVLITAKGDGTFTVALNEDDDDPSAESGQDSDDQPQTADSLEDALKIAGEMFGAESQEGDDDSGSSDDEKLTPDVAQSYWTQMASKKGKASRVQ